MLLINAVLENTAQVVCRLRRCVMAGSGTVDFNEFLRMMSRSQYHVNRVQGRSSGEHGRNVEELEEMRQAFRVFDIDGNGVIDENELKITMFNLGENLSDCDVKQMIKLADRNGDGKIDYEGTLCLRDPSRSPIQICRSESNDHTAPHVALTGVQFCRAMLRISAAYAVVWCLSATFVYSVEMNKHIFRLFFIIE